MTNFVKAIALTTALSLSVAVVPSLHALSAQYQDHNQSQDQNREHGQYGDQNHSNYQNNSFYRLGNREGYQDYQRKAQRKEHNHKFRSDDDRHAHDSGYQEGWQGRQYNSNTDRPH